MDTLSVLSESLSIAESKMSLESVEYNDPSNVIELSTTTPLLSLIELSTLPILSVVAPSIPKTRGASASCRVPLLLPASTFLSTPMPTVS